MISLFQTQVLPVVAFNRLDQVLPLADVFLQAGIDAIEVTLRTPIALTCLELLANKRPEIHVGAGTVLTPSDLDDVWRAGAQFALSPACILNVLQHAKAIKMPFFPGVMTPSDILLAQQEGFDQCKFFPAEISGGIDFLKAMAGPFPHMQFCPTGGIGLHNVQAYLKHSQVFVVGGTWLSPQEALNEHDWPRLAAIAQLTVDTLLQK